MPPVEFPKGKRPCFVGVGNSPCRRYSGRSLATIAAEGALAAIADAGLNVTDIDGISVFPSAPYQNARNIQGYDTVGANYMMQILGIENLRWAADLNGPMAVVSVIEAANALAAGACNYVLVYRTLHHPAGERYGQFVGANVARGAGQWARPFGQAAYNQEQATHYQRYLSLYGAKREELATTVLNDHDNAQLNPNAVWNGRPITLEDYLNSRIIAYPMCIFDNDMPVDGCGAVVMTTEDRARDLPHKPAFIKGYAQTPFNKLKGGVLQYLEDVYEMEYLMARNLYESASVGPKDIDVIHVYNGFAPMVWNWLEVFGFCEQGEAHNWVQDGKIKLTGSHPLNTSGGNLGEGRLHGMAHITETARQLMGTAGPRQIKDAEVALCEVGPFPSGAAFIAANS